MNDNMRLSADGLAALKRLEGYTPTAKHLAADRPNVLTGGYGDTRVTLGETHTEAEWSERLLKRLALFEGYVIGGAHVPLAQHEFDALVLFCYNVGPGDPYVFPAIEGFLTSTLLTKLNAGDRAGAAAQFLRWVRSAGQVQAGLIVRRKFEQDWFLGLAPQLRAA